MENCLEALSHHWNEYWKYIVPTQIYFPLSSLPVWKQNQQNQNVQHSILPHSLRLPQAKVYKSLSDFFIPEQEQNHH